MTKDKNEGKKAKPAARGGEVMAQPLGSLRDQIDRLFEDFGRGFPGFGRPFGAIEPFRGFEFQDSIKLPAVDVVEQDGRYVIKAEMPGITEDDIDVELAEGVLTVKGEKRHEHEEEKDNVHIAERQYGSFKRSFRLPADAQPEDISAACKDGVVEIVIPRARAPEPETRKIAISKS